MPRVELGMGRLLLGGTVIPELRCSGEVLATEHNLLGCHLSQEGSLWPCDFTVLPPSPSLPSVSAPRCLL